MDGQIAHYNNSHLCVGGHEQPGTLSQWLKLLLKKQSGGRSSYSSAEEMRSY